MAEFFALMTVLEVLFFGWLALAVIWRFKIRKAAAEAEEQKTKTEEPQPSQDITVVARSVNDVVGKYQDNTIYRYVQTKDGRMFTFESVAVEVHPGVYHGDFPDKKYIVVDKCLLYREVPAS